MTCIVRRVASGLVLAALCWIGAAGQAAAATASPAWGIESLASPTNFSAQDNGPCKEHPGAEAVEFCDTYVVTATNVGAERTTPNGRITLTDTLPPGIKPVEVSLFAESTTGPISKNISEVVGESVCTDVPVRCELTGHGLVELESHGVIKHHSLEPDQALKMYVSVVVEGSAVPGVLSNQATVKGGIEEEAGAPLEVSVTNTNTLASNAPAFGANLFDAPLVGLNGQPELQAGAHPYEIDTRIGLNSVKRETAEGKKLTTTVQDIRDVVVDLPVGLAGSAVMAPQCPLARLASRGEAEKQGHSGCPTDTIVGHIRTYPESTLAAIGPIYNLVPEGVPAEPGGKQPPHETGVAAELGFIDATGGTHILYVTLAPTPAGYVVRTTSREIPQLRLSEVLADVFGDPAARDASGETPVPTFTNPEDCTGENLKTTIYMDSWQAPGSYNADGTPNLSDPNWVSSTYESPPVSGCEALAGLFEPSIAARVSTERADSPSGLDFELSVPQHEGVNELATPPLRDTTVVLPPGLAVNPSSANGLQACSLEQIGIGKDGVPNEAPVTCPHASKLGTVEVETPALPSRVCKRSYVPVQECPEDEVEKAVLSGSVYLAQQGEGNPFDSLIALYIVIEEPRRGIVIKVPAKVTLNEATGQLTTTVTDTPQFPFSVLRTDFFEGNTAALSTPTTCGSYALTSELTPWSAPQSGSPAALSAVPFTVNHSPSGGACAAPGFSPSFNAGSAGSQAGAYSPFSVTFSRQDGEQYLGGTTITTPLGVLGNLASVARCPEPQASQGNCGPESQIGEVTTSVGAGPDPYLVKGGKVYLTGPYNNGPFGLSIVVPTSAGPFTLTGNGGYGKEVVRASIRINPHTAQVTVLSDPLPSMIEGIPLQIRTVNVTVSRPGFMFNPTTCEKRVSEAAFTSTQNGHASASNAYYASGCASLPFKPSFAVSSSAHTSKADGASLDVKVAPPAQGPTSPSGHEEANIKSVKVELPRQLPSRLTTLQKACLAAQFEANPAGCPAASVVGTAIAHTPILAGALTGPAYFVSHGNEAFPQLVIVLQGEGITVDLVGDTFISKAEVTSSTFKEVPDVPVSSFELSLPQGPYSALAANANVCEQPLVMPTEITGQNGRTFTQRTIIEVQGCPSAIRLVSHQIHKRTVTIHLFVPAAGKVELAGRGLRAKTVTAKAAETLAVTVQQKRRGRLKTKLEITYTPTKSATAAAVKRQVATVGLRFQK